MDNSLPCLWLLPLLLLQDLSSIIFTMPKKIASTTPKIFFGTPPFTTQSMATLFFIEWAGPFGGSFCFAQGFALFWLLRGRDLDIQQQSEAIVLGEQRNRCYFDGLSFFCHYPLLSKFSMVDLLPCPVPFFSYSDSRHHQRPRKLQGRLGEPLPYLAGSFWS
jgi:hypothetical protein